MSIARPEVPDWIRSVIILDRQDVFGSVIEMGLAELAVRLGYPGGFDNRGDVLFVDSFEEGLSKGKSGTSGTGGEVEASSTSARLRGLSLKLTAGKDASRYAYYEYWLPYPVLGKVGLQLAFTVDANTDYLWFLISLYNGDNWYQGHFKYDSVNSKLQVYDDTDTPQDIITDAPLYQDPKAYHYFKGVIDLEEYKYHRALLDGWSWTDADINLATGTSGLSKRFNATVYHYGLLDTNPVSYVDGVIFTQNEPK